MASTVGTPQERSWASNKATRTKAMPKTTLFGSALEMQTAQQKNELANINLAQVDEEVLLRNLPKKNPNIDERKLPGS